MSLSVSGSPGVEMGVSGDAIPVPEVEPEDPAEVNTIYLSIIRLIYLFINYTLLIFTILHLLHLLSVEIKYSAIS